MLIPDENGYLLKPDAPVLSTSIPRVGSVTVKDGTRQACQVGTYETTTDITSLLSTLKDKDGYIFYYPDKEMLERTTTSPTLQPFDASLVITGESTIADYCFEICLDGLPTNISEANGQWSMVNGQCVYDLSGRKINVQSSSAPYQRALVQKNPRMVNGQLPHGIFLLPTPNGYRKVLK